MVQDIVEVRSMLEASALRELFLCDNCNQYSKDKGACKCGAPKRRVGLEELVNETPYIEYVFSDLMKYVSAEVTLEFNDRIVTIVTEDRTLEGNDPKYGEEKIPLLKSFCDLVDSNCKKKFFERMKKVLQEEI